MPTLDLRHPGAVGLRIEIRRYPADVALFWSFGPRAWLAWTLRSMADWVDGYSFRGRLPRRCDAQDWEDAMAYGAGAMGRYLADVSEERAHE